MVFAWTDLALVGSVARAHGLRGKVIVNPETDFPDERFKPGNDVWIQRPGGVERLRIAAVEWLRGRPIVTFAGVETLEEARQLAGAELRVSAEDLIELPAETFYRHDLVGCRVATMEGVPVGVVADVEGPRDASRLVIRTGRGEALVPLAREICVEIDPPGRRIVIAAPEGLLDLNEVSKRR